jgi:hypothetical protein
VPGVESFLTDDVFVFEEVVFTMGGAVVMVLEGLVVLLGVVAQHEQLIHI